MRNALEEEEDQIPVESSLISIGNSTQNALEEEALISLQCLLVSVRNSLQHALEEEEQNSSESSLFFYQKFNAKCSTRGSQQFITILIDFYWEFMAKRAGAGGGVPNSIRVRLMSN
jgi:hypothetical protein